MSVSKKVGASSRAAKSSPLPHGPPLQPVEPTHIGWLWKKGTGFFTRNTWKRRWCKLVGSQFIWYTNETEEAKERGHLSIADVKPHAFNEEEIRLMYQQSSSTRREAQWIFELHLLNSKDNIILAAESELERQTWIASIQREADHEHGRRTSLPSATPSPHIPNSSTRTPLQYLSPTPWNQPLLFVSSSVSNSPRNDSPSTPVHPSSDKPSRSTSPMPLQQQLLQSSQSPHAASSTVKVASPPSTSSALATSIGTSTAESTPTTSQPNSNTTSPTVSPNITGTTAFGAHVASVHSEHPILASITIDATERSIDNSYVLYVITISNGQLKWQLRKRYSDFIVLHSFLIGKHGKPFIKLHHLALPPKTASNNAAVIEARRTQFQAYLGILNHCADLISSPFVMSFLGLLQASSTQLDIEEEQRYLKNLSRKERDALAQVQQEEQNVIEAAASQSTDATNSTLMDPMTTPTNVVASSTALPATLPTLTQSRSLHQRRSIHASHVPDLVNTGDILLICHHDSTLSKIQRKILNAQYDHIAMIVRRPIMSTSKHSLCVFEANSDGVRCTPLENVLDSWLTKSKLKSERISSENKLPTRDGSDSLAQSDPNASTNQFITVCIRRLKNWNPIKANLQALDEFIQHSLGHSYSLKGLLWPKHNQLTNNTNETNDSSTTPSTAVIPTPTTSPASIHSSTTTLAADASYYCAELIAHAYQIVGLFPPATSSSRICFLPNDFSVNNQWLHLSDQVTMSEDINILFHQLALAEAVQQEI